MHPSSTAKETTDSSLCDDTFAIPYSTGFKESLDEAVVNAEHPTSQLKLLDADAADADAADASGETTRTLIATSRKPV